MTMELPGRWKRSWLITLLMIEWEIRLCKNSDCGLRFPAEKGHPNGLRCPICLGETKEVLTFSAKDRKRTPAITLLDPIPISGLLDNIRSTWNVGSIFRTSEGFGVQHLYLTGITSTPDTADLGKTALGAEQSVTWSLHRNAVTLVKQLAKEDYLLWALEINSRARPASQMERFSRFRTTIKRDNPDYGKRKSRGGSRTA